jgi:two-component system OmpR family sensor kinase
MTARQPGVLHRRLALIVACVLLVALALSGTFTYLAFAAYLQDRLDASLRETPIVFAAKPPAGGGPRVTPFAQLIGADGKAEQTQTGRDASGHTFTAVLPATLPRPAKAAGLAGPAKYFDADSRAEGGPRLRVKVTADTTGAVLVIALPRTGNDTLLHRLALLEGGVGAAALLVTTLAASWLVRRRLAPLRKLSSEVEALRPDDLSARVEVAAATREVHDLAVATNVLLGRMQTAQERLRQFVADASHELRTPIAAVSAYAQLFEMGAKDRPEDLARSMSGIQREAARLRTLADALLTLAATEDARPSCSAAGLPTVDLAAVLPPAADAALAVDPRWPVSVVLQPPLAEAAADPDQLGRVLDNLLGNVRAHTPPGTATQVTAVQRGEHIVVEVADDGPGLTAADRARMFDRFWRKDGSRSRDAGGNGLGLSIVCALVSSVGGSVSASPTPGGGLTVSLSLPAAGPHRPPASPYPRQQQSGGPDPREPPL